MTKHYFEILNNSNNLIKGDLRIPFLESLSPLIIFSHGFKGFRNWGFIPYVVQKFAENGFISINYDFSLNGIIDDINQVYDDNIFRKNTVSSEINDLKTLIENIINYQNIFDKIKNLWNNDIFLLGHSLGGAISILVAPSFNQIKRISLWASISNLDRNTQRQKEIWKERGFTEVEIRNTGQKLHVDYSYIEDKDNNLGKNIINRTINNLEIPIQIIHPKMDKTVNIKEAFELKSSESDIKTRDLYVLENSGHLFNSKHPFTGTNTALENAINVSLKFLKSEYV